MDTRRKYTTYYSSRGGKQAQPLNNSKKRRRWPYVIAILVLVVVGYFGLFGNSRTSSKAQKSPSFAVDSAGLDQSVNAILKNVPQNVQISVAIVDLSSQKTFYYGTDAPFNSASVAKLVTATLFLHEVEQGTYSLTQNLSGKTAREQLRLMIMQSDNDAWKVLNDELTHPKLDQWAQTNGMTNYSSDQNVMETKDVAVLLQKLYNKQLLDEQQTNLLMSFMESSENSLISDFVPAGTTVYRKAGWLDDRYHEAAIVDDGKHPYVLVVFSKSSGEYSSEIGRGIFKSIVNATTTAFR